MPHDVIFLLVPDFQLLDMSGPAAVFQTAGSSAPPPVRPMRFTSCRSVAARCGVLRGRSPDSILARRAFRHAGGAGRRARRRHPGHAQVSARASPGRPAPGQRLHGRIRAGGRGPARRAARHHSLASCRRARAQPSDVRVDADRIHVCDGDTWTSAGITAGIDLALAMVESDLGAEVAGATAREMVVYHRRSGGQSQFSALQDLAPDSERIRVVLEHIRGNLGAALTVEHLADVAVSARASSCAASRPRPAKRPPRRSNAFGRRRRARTEAGADSIDSVARRAGFTDSERMRRTLCLRPAAAGAAAHGQARIKKRALFLSLMTPARKARHPAGTACKTKMGIEL